MALYLVQRYIKAQKQAVLDLARSYFEANGDTPSQFGAAVDLIAQNFARRMMQSLRAELMNMQSLNTRQSKAIAGQMAVDRLASMGGVGEATVAIPGVEKMIKKNPMLQLLAAFLANKMTGAPAQMTGAPAQMTGAPASAPPSNGNSMDITRI